MNKKGFTLIELLAVIVILAIIALITTPIVLNLINQSKEAANKRSVEAYAKAVEYAVINYEYSNNGELPANFDVIEDNVEYSNSDVKCIVQINGDTKGAVELCGCQVGSYTNTYYKYSSKHGSKGATVDSERTDARTSSTKGSCKDSPVSYTDSNNDGEISLGDTVKLKNDEFFVINSSDGEVMLLAKYNLDANSRQSSSNPVAVSFASTLYWFDGTATYDDGASGYKKIYRVSSGQDGNNNLKTYINNYKDYLEDDLEVEDIIDVRIMTYDDALLAGCTTSAWSCPEYVTNQTYWLGSANYSSYVWYIGGSNIADKNGTNSNDGVRPLVIISESAL